MVVLILRINSVVLSITWARKYPLEEAVYYRDFRKNIKPTQTIGGHRSFFGHYPPPVLRVLSSAKMLLAVGVPTIRPWECCLLQGSSLPLLVLKLGECSTWLCNKHQPSPAPCSLCLIWTLSVEIKGTVSQRGVRSRASESLSHPGFCSEDILQSVTIAALGHLTIRDYSQPKLQGHGNAVSHQRTHKKEHGMGEVDSSLWWERLEEGIREVREELGGRSGSIGCLFWNQEDRWEKGWPG